jgi:hypothetical protein
MVHFDCGATMPQAVHVTQAFNFPCEPRACPGSHQRKWAVGDLRGIASAPAIVRYCLATGSGWGLSDNVLR